MLVKKCSKFSKPGFRNTWTMKFQMFKLVLEKAEEPEIKLPTSTVLNHLSSCLTYRKPDLNHLKQNRKYIGLYKWTVIQLLSKAQKMRSSLHFFALLPFYWPQVLAGCPFLILKKLPIAVSWGTYFLLNSGWGKYSWNKSPRQKFQNLLSWFARFCLVIIPWTKLSSEEFADCFKPSID